MLIPILIFLVFAIFVALMATNKMPAVIALPVLGVILALIGGIPIDQIQGTVIEEGVMMLRGAYIPIIFAGILGQVVSKTGIAENIVRRAAELGGDNPIIVALLCLVAVAFVFTGLIGAGAVIMVGMIVLPIMVSVGVPNMVAGGVLLMGVFLGFTFNVARWQFFVNLIGVEMDVVKQFSVIFMIPTAIIAVIMIFIGIKKQGKVFAWATEEESDLENNITSTDNRIPVYALITPIIPLVTVFFLDWGVVSSLMVGMIYGIVTTQWTVGFKGTWNLITSSIFEGFSTTALTVALMFGVGILVQAATNEQLVQPIGTIIDLVYPTSILGFVVLFGVFGPPLTQYRGPMNPWGLGGAVASIMAAGSLSLPALLGAMFALDYVVTVSCPTSSQVVWTAGYLDRSPVKLQKATILFTWITALIGVIITAIIYPLFK